MNDCFADTYYFLALLSGRDKAHSDAEKISHRYTGRIVTTAWILTEIADGLAPSKRRSAFAVLMKQLRNDPQTIIVSPSQELFEEGEQLYNARLDKEWSLTDYISFVVMKRHGLSDALTADRHYEQAGFRAMLLR